MRRSFRHPGSISRDNSDPKTLDLVQRDFVLQVFPEQAPPDHAVRFREWLEGLAPEELTRRRAAFADGESARIHVDKWLQYRSALIDAQALELARTQSRGRWIEVEETTANEFMASLALALSQEDLATSAHGEAIRFLPATDQARSFDALIGQAHHARTVGAASGQLNLRLEGERRVKELRTILLERVLPVPTDPPTADQIENFRRKHGDSLPAFRRHLERLVETIMGEDDEAMQLRMIDRIADEIDELVIEVEAYLSEGGFRRIRRSALVHLLKIVPGLPGAVSAIQGAAGALETAGRIEVDPLAYLAFARAKLRLDDRRLAVPWDQRLLVEAFSRDHEG